ncbi:MAG: glucosyl transferase, partial [Calditrichaeota bacterium]|nr:glucosyl transferase [Calditrichota bacterium]
VAYDSGLLPNQNYTYQARLLQDGKALARSNILNLTTLDTTSHDFAWEIIEFPSPYGSGALYDVAIIDENNIWAVGEIYADSAQPWLPYNAVHWDGERWNLKRIQFRYFCNQPETFSAPAKSVLAFGPNDIYIAAGSQLAHWNGEKQDD